MKLRVSHKTIYRYETEQDFVLQSHRLVPSEFDGQKTLEWQVDVPGGIGGSRFRDGAGDVTSTMRLHGPVNEVTIEISGLVETIDLAGVLRGHRERVPPDAYLQSTRHTRVDIGLRELANRAIEHLDEAGALDRAHALSGMVGEAIAYTPGTTEPQHTAAEVLAQGRGVCQDHAHVLLAAARVVGIPARYVAGYLFSDPDAPDDPVAAAPGSEASHAWTELFIDGLGWVGFDAANGCCPDDRYVRLCSGLDAFDAAPIRGIAGGVGEETLDVSVAVQSVQQ